MVKYRLELRQKGTGSVVRTLSECKTASEAMKRMARYRRNFKLYEGIYYLDIGVSCE